MSETILGQSVLVGMSGGVDSSVTAHLLKEAGFYVEGLSLLMWDAKNRTNFKSCCSVESADSARETAGLIGIKFNVIDAREPFTENVIEPFVESYLSGYTPNPCIMCNEHVKFPLLLAAARAKGFDYIATGHYTRRIANGGKVSLLRGIDDKKDQSYFLYVLSSEVLSKLLLPLGTYTKTLVREISEKFSWPASRRQESQDVCFVGSGGYQKFICDYMGYCAPEGGTIVDVDGATIGTHDGVYSYTIGQRRGIGVAAKTPLYVLDIDASSNTLVVGPRELGLKSEILVENVKWLHGVPSTWPVNATIKLRSGMVAKQAAITPVKGSLVRVAFLKPQWAPARGQSAVFYMDDEVLGGGVIV